MLNNIATFVEEELEHTAAMSHAEAVKQLDQAYADGWVPEETYYAIHKAFVKREALNCYIRFLEHGSREQESAELDAMNARSK